jgi:PLP dependent protein
MYICRTSPACYCSLALLVKSYIRCDSLTVLRYFSKVSSRPLSTNLCAGRKSFSLPRIRGGFETRATKFEQLFSRGMSSKSSNNDDPKNELVEADDELDVDVESNYLAVKHRVENAVSKLVDHDSDMSDVRLVAVSKTKPLELLQRAYSAGCRHFGENYVQELVDKVEMWSMNCVGVHWHFIGTLQSNKCTTLVKCMAHKDIGLFTVETISSENLAKKLNNAVMKVGTDGKTLKVFVQVNTSGEESKGGVEPGKETISLCRYIAKECPGLDLRGLMTIGAPGDLGCFATLGQCRETVMQVFKEEGITFYGGPQLELSMGMSGDFEEAIAAGSTNVRVGSTIFGERNYSTEPIIH